MVLSVGKGGLLVVTKEGRPALLHWHESHQPALIAIPLDVAQLQPLVVSDIGNEHPNFEIPEVAKVKARLNLTKSKLDAIFLDPEGGKVFDKLLTDLDFYRDLSCLAASRFIGSFSLPEEAQALITPICARHPSNPPVATCTCLSAQLPDSP
ncbi:hypothetical protein CYMTET_24362 [Cymbomonas tetramitiformis]|uniref:Uncharacterized protein n=1 Tax=Cymbomonas tetramitiformis TaxID=36881 RepID=A0AAE0FW17_9CHLO|nr:hypothetical protein CYMTET_24362 [Cymbomonas tetramitiformis]